jgi:hypothetical protein
MRNVYICFLNKNFKKMNKFSEIYSEFSASELVKIILHQSDYQKEAVEAAKAEIEKRNLSDKAIEHEIQNLEKKDKIREEGKWAKAEIKILQYTKNFWSHINPFQKELPRVEIIIRSIILLLALLFIHNLPLIFNISYVFAEPFSTFGILVLLDSIPLLYIPLTLLYFFRKKKIGWSLTVIGFTCLFIRISNTLIYSILNPFSDSEFIFMFFPRIPITSYIVLTLFFGAILVTLLRKMIRSIYSISIFSFVISLLIGFIFGIFNLNLLV